ncbi:MAG: ATP-binding protein [Pseudomonadales bacterium]
MFLLLPVVVLSLFCGQTTFAETSAAQQPPANVLLLSHSTAGQLPLAAHTTFYDPGVQAPELADVIQTPETHWRTPAQKTASLVLHPRHAIWYRISLYNDQPETQTLLLRDSSPVTDTMSSYLCLEPNNVHSCRKNLKHAHNKNLQVVQLLPQQSATLFVEATGFHSSIFTLSLQTKSVFTAWQYKQRIYFGLLDGILCGLAIYSILLAIHTKQKTYWAYYVFSSCLVATFFIHQDFFYTFSGILPNTWLTNLSILTPLADSASLACFLGFYIFKDKITSQALTALKLYTATILSVGAAFLLQAPTMFLFPIYIVTTMAAFAYFFYIFLSKKIFLELEPILLATGIALPFYNFSATLLAALGIIHPHENGLVLTQSIEALSALLLASAIVLSIKQLQTESEQQYRAAAQANITSDAHNRLLSHLNHELRTPLNGILGASEILMHKSHIPKDRRVFSMIYHTALPLKYLIEDIVNIKAITKNQTFLQYSRFDLHSLLQECMDVFLLTAHDKKIRLYFQMDNNVTSDITADANRLRQILINLLGNACKFTSNGIVGLHVTQQPMPITNEHLYCFEVIDNGSGVSAADEGALFQFFESRNSTANPKGTGIGLSVVRELSHLMGGSCGYRKNPIAGSTFWFNIRVTTHHNTTRKTHSAFEGLNILLADEDIDLVNSVHEKISDAAKTLITANTEQQVLDAIAYTKDCAEHVNKTQIDIALIHSTLASSGAISAVLASGIPLLVYQDYDELTSSEQSIEARKGYEIIHRKPSIETFSLNVAEAILRKNHLIHKHAQKLTRRIKQY